MKKLKSKTQKIYDRTRRVTKAYFSKMPHNLHLVPFFFISAERYFLNVQNYNGLFFIRKNHLRCFLHKAKVRKDLAESTIVDRFSNDLIEVAREKGVMKPSYSKLFIQSKINLAKLLVRNGQFGKAQKTITEAFYELNLSRTEFPDYYKSDIFESDLFHLQRMLDETIEGEE